MCTGGGGSAPRPAPVLPEAPRTPDATAGVGEGGDKRRRARASQTLLTSPRGVETSGSTATKTLLGS